MELSFIGNITILKPLLKKKAVLRAKAEYNQGHFYMTWRLPHHWTYSLFNHANINNKLLNINLQWSTEQFVFYSIIIVQSLIGSPSSHTSWLIKSGQTASAGFHTVFKKQKQKKKTADLDIFSYYVAGVI